MALLQAGEDFPRRKLLLPLLPHRCLPIHRHFRASHLQSRAARASPRERSVRIRRVHEGEDRGGRKVQPMLWITRCQV